MKNTNSAKEWFYSQGTTEADEFQNDPLVKNYVMKHTGQHISEIHITSGYGDANVEIAQITDIHFNYVSSITDVNDRELEYTKQCRKWNGESESVLSAIRAMDVAQYADQTIVTGDTLDYLSKGALLLTQRYLFSRDPNIIITLGGHDITKQMQTSLNDETPLSERYDMLKTVWSHDLFYVSRNIGKRVLAVCLDNGSGRFLSCQPEQLEQDIIRARNENRIILIFMHEPIAAKNSSGPIPAIIKMDGADSYFDFNGPKVIGNKATTDEATIRVYELITENADVIKGIFCGHEHSSFHTDISATYQDQTGIHPSNIPQFVASGNPYFGHCGSVTRIIVE